MELVIRAFSIFLASAFVLGEQPSVPYKGQYPGITGYVINGEEAEDGKYPYMLSLNTEEKYHVCGASILTKKWALTAAHCCEIMEYETLYLLSGTNSISTGGSNHSIDSYKIHPNFSPIYNWRNDYCVIKVKDEFKFGERVQQVTLPLSKWPIKHGSLVNITGWGYTTSNKTEMPDKLQLGRDFRALSEKECLRITGYEHESYLCAWGNTGQGVCNGDSGSPLMKDKVQVGIASWIFTPCGGGMPDFYARVSTAIDWIKKTLGPDSCELKFAKS